MFREMRRKNQALSYEDSVQILLNGTSGVLAVHGDDDYPYAVPLSYIYDDNKLFFHCAKTGHKMDAIAGSNKVSFCVIDKDQVVPEEYTTYFRSVIAFGRARILEDAAEKESALKRLGKKYSPDHEQGFSQEIIKQLAHVCIVEVAIEHVSGKEAIELVREKHKQQ